MGVVRILRRAALGRLFRQLTFFIIGAFGYGVIEILWRGSTHASMLLLGGICFLILLAIDRKGFSLPVKCALGATAITALELITGCIVNRWMGLSVWDYSAYRWNLLGQICPLYSLLWFLLCLFIFGVKGGADAALRRIARYLCDRPA